MSDSSLKPLEYRRQVKISGYITLAMIGVFFFVGLFIMIAALKGGEEMFGLGLLIWVFAIPMVLQYIFMMRPLMLSKIFIYDDRIVIQRKKKEIVIPFADIDKLSTAVQKNIGGWFSITTRNKKIFRFTVVLEKADLLLDAILKARPDLLDQDSYEKLRTKLIVLDQGVERYYSFFKAPYVGWTVFHMLIIPALVGSMCFMRQGKDMVIHAPVRYFLELGFHMFVIGSILQMIFILILNKSLYAEATERLKKDRFDRNRNLGFESSTYKKIFPVYLATYCLCLALYGTSNFNLDYSRTVESWETGLGVKVGQTYTVDQRYNCRECKYQIEKDDVIDVSGLTIAKVVAFPGEEVEIKKYSHRSRSVASLGSKVVPKGKVAVSEGDLGNVYLVEESEIYGKLVK